MMEFLSIELETYSVKTATLLNTSCLKKPYFEKKVYGGPAS